MQHYGNHVRYYWPHHVLFYGAIVGALGVCLFFAFQPPSDSWVWWGFSFLIALLGAFSFMARQHYALTLQNRMVLLEMRYRYFALTQRRFEPFEETLDFGQIAALRFAPDEELEGLVQRAVSEKMEADAIKKSIRRWKADKWRV